MVSFTSQSIDTEFLALQMIEEEEFIPQVLPELTRTNGYYIDRIQLFHNNSQASEELNINNQGSGGLNNININTEIITQHKILG